MSTKVFTLSYTSVPDGTGSDSYAFPWSECIALCDEWMAEDAPDMPQRTSIAIMAMLEALPPDTPLTLTIEGVEIKIAAA
jgi:hypothetical protein